MKKEKYKLCLYIAGKTQKAERAMANLKKICEEELADIVPATIARAAE
jgi:hypothetical protein